MEENSNICLKFREWNKLSNKKKLMTYLKIMGEAIFDKEDVVVNIEYRSREDAKWAPATTPSDWRGCQYRIKPRHLYADFTKETFRPHKHRAIRLAKDTMGFEYEITAVCDEGVRITRVQPYIYKWHELRQEWFFVDTGLPVAFINESED